MSYLKGTGTVTDRKSIVDQLYGRYLDSELVQTTEDSLTRNDIANIVRQTGITKEIWNEDRQARRGFWDRVASDHYAAL